MDIVGNEKARSTVAAGAGLDNNSALARASVAGTTTAQHQPWRRLTHADIP